MRVFLEIRVLLEGEPFQKFYGMEILHAKVIMVEIHVFIELGSWNFQKRFSFFSIIIKSLSLILHSSSY